MMRWVVTVIAVLAVLGCLAASAFMNYLFMTSLGKTAIERQVFGIVSLAVSGFLAVLPVLILWARQEGRVVAALLGVVLFVFCAAVSLSSAVGFAASNRGETAGARETVTAKFAAAQAALEEAETRLKALPPARPAAVIDEAIEGVKQKRLWLASKECGDSQSPAARKFCEGLSVLKVERATAGEAETLQTKIERLRGEIGALRDQGAGREADAQAAVIGRALGIGPKGAQEALALLIAVVVELMAGFGFYIATSHLPPPAPPANGAQPRADEPEGKVIDLVARDVTAGKPRLGGRRAPVAQIAAPVRLHDVVRELKKKKG